MAIHGNSHENKKDHHLYAIQDNEENDVFKYGISDKVIGEDGQSSRMKIQVNYLNKAVGWIRYIAIIILRSIPGRVAAKKSEQEHIDEYELKHGRKPRGNN